MADITFIWVHSGSRGTLVEVISDHPVPGSAYPVVRIDLRQKINLTTCDRIERKQNG